MTNFDINRPEFLDGPRVRSHEVEGLRVWVKRPEAPRAKIWLALQHLLSRLLPLPMLRPTVSSGGSLALLEESKRLKDFAAAGFYVPVVLGVNDRMMVTQDAGIELKSYIHTAPEEAAARLQQAAQTLGQLHRQGLVHGRPYLKDFIWHASSQSVGFLDLEENPVAVMPLADAQARDIWLFLGSCAQFFPHQTTEHLVALYDNYAVEAGNVHQAPLRCLVMWLHPIARMIKKCGGAKAGKDIARALASTDALACIFARLRGSQKT